MQRQADLPSPQAVRPRAADPRDRSLAQRPAVPPLAGTQPRRDLCRLLCCIRFAQNAPGQGPLHAWLARLDAWPWSGGRMERELVRRARHAAVAPDPRLRIGARHALRRLRLRQPPARPTRHPLSRPRQLLGHRRRWDLHRGGDQAHRPRPVPGETASFRRDRRLNLGRDRPMASRTSFSPMRCSSTSPRKSSESISNGLPG